MSCLFQIKICTRQGSFKSITTMFVLSQKKKIKENNKLVSFSSSDISIEILLDYEN